MDTGNDPTGRLADAMCDAMCEALIHGPKYLAGCGCLCFVAGAILTGLVCWLLS